MSALDRTDGELAPRASAILLALRKVSLSVGQLQERIGDELSLELMQRITLLRQVANALRDDRVKYVRRDNREAAS